MYSQNSKQGKELFQLQRFLSKIALVGRANVSQYLTASFNPFCFCNKKILSLEITHIKFNTLFRSINAPELCVQESKLKSKAETDLRLVMHFLTQQKSVN